MHGSGSRLALAQAVRLAARPLVGRADDFASMIEAARKARVVAIGVSTYGSRELFVARAQLTSALVEAGFDALVVSASWADARAVTCRLRAGAPPEEALAAFEGFPAWVHANRPTAALLEQHRLPVYGHELGGLERARRQVLAYLEQVDARAAARASLLFGCFDRFSGVGEAYGFAAAFGLLPPCDRAVAEVRALLEARTPADASDAERLFAARQAARAVAAEEAFQRLRPRAGHVAWNRRAAHQADVADVLLARHRKLVVWGHAADVADARSTGLGEEALASLGQLLRERHPGEVLLVGASTFAGTQLVSRDLRLPPGPQPLPHALHSSYESLFHDVGLGSLLLHLDELGEAAGGLREPRLSRAHGPLEGPAGEPVLGRRHWLKIALPRALDAVLHIDQSTPVRPLADTSRPDPPPASTAEGGSAPPSADSR